MNVVHSVDAYVLRSMHRRCNYDSVVVEGALHNIQLELQVRNQPCDEQPLYMADSQVAYYVEQYKRSGIPDVVILPHLKGNQTIFLSTEHLLALERIIKGMLQYKPFLIVTVHDSFAAHPNNVNWVRYQYKEIMAEIADSNLIDDLLSQIHGVKGHFKKLSEPGVLGALIRQSNYGLC